MMPSLQCLLRKNVVDKVDAEMNMPYHKQAEAMDARVQFMLAWSFDIWPALVEHISDTKSPFATHPAH